MTVDLRWGERSYVHVDGVAVHVEEAGGGAERPVLALLHGFGSGTFTWAGVAPTWSETHRLLAWDRPPFGRSDRPRPPGRNDVDPYATAAVLARARAVLDARAGGAPVVLVGHSAGTLVAAQLVADGFPAAGLVLIAPALDGSPPELVRRLFGLPGAGVVGAAFLRVAFLGTGIALRRIGMHGTPLIEATGVETGRMLRRAGTAEALVHLTRTWKRPELLESVGPLGVPTMVISGIEDRISTPTATRDVADRLGADLHVLEGVGHAPHEQVPEIVGPLVGWFVESLTAEDGR